MTQKYLLDSDTDAEALSDLRMYLLGSSKKNDQYQLRLGSLTKLLRQVPTFAYDLPELTEKFPQSFISNDVLFINAKLLNSKEYRNEDLHQAKVTVANALLDLVQKNLDVSISKDEKIEALSKVLTIGIEDKSLLNNNPIIEMKDLEVILINAGLPLENAQLSKKLGDSSSKIKDYLLSDDEFKEFTVNKKSNKPNI